MPDSKLKLVPEVATPRQIEEMELIAEVMIETVGKIDASLIYATGVSAAPDAEGPADG